MHNAINSLTCTLRSQCCAACICVTKCERGMRPNQWQQQTTVWLDGPDCVYCTHHIRTTVYSTDENFHRTVIVSKYYNVRQFIYDFQVNRYGCANNFEIKFWIFVQFFRLHLQSKWRNPNISSGFVFLSFGFRCLCVWVSINALPWEISSQHFPTEINFINFCAVFGRLAMASVPAISNSYHLFCLFILKRKYLLITLITLNSEFAGDIWYIEMKRDAYALHVVFPN